MIEEMAGMAGKSRRMGDLAAFPRGMSVADAVRGWGERGLAVVCGGGPAWGVTVLGEVSGKWQIGKPAGQPMKKGAGAGILAEMRKVLTSGAGHRPRGAVTGATDAFSGGWVVALSYGLGGEIEPRAGGRVGSGGWPLIEMQRCDRVVGFDHGRGEWIGELELLPRGEHWPCKATTSGTRAFEVGELRSDTGRARYEEMVARGVEYIRAGDVFQVNLAHRLSGSFSGSTRGAFAALVESGRPWHGAYLELQGDNRRALVSASPELFLKVEGNRVMTRPMKGTRSGAADASELRDSGKDLAELNMIIDLMRNDLGRVCRFGSVRVEGERQIERHGSGDGGTGGSGVWQGVGTVVGELREGMDVVDLLAAAFPAGSVTGAPKIRAMQIIEELEVSERGPYCGSIGWIGDDGQVSLNVAIRTACISGPAGVGVDEVVGGMLSYSVGAGIVADSDPAREWEETLEKAGVLGALGSSSAESRRAT